MNILQTIAKRKAEEVAVLKINQPLTGLIRPKHYDKRDFIRALRGKTKPSIIAEIKKASPSKGIIRENFQVPTLAKSYADNGASCLSVLTDIDFFQGHPDYLAQARSQCNLPVLRKDFIIDRYQIHESWAMGADCILLIVALLDDIQLQEFCQLATELGMAVLVESHTKEELERAITLPTPLIGINNRSLEDFTTDIKLSIQLKKYIPEDKIIITESGINTLEDVKLMQSHGINTFLIGESFMRAQDVGAALRELMV